MEDRRAAIKGLDRLFSYLGGIKYFLRPDVEDCLLRESEREGGLFKVRHTSIDKRYFINKPLRAVHVSKLLG